MKRIRCPKCEKFITFDETKYADASSLVFVCPNCKKQFGIRLNVSQKAKEPTPAQEPTQKPVEQQIGCIVVIENVFQYKQVFPLQMGDNIIGKYSKGNAIHCPIETSDPSIDMTHCNIQVSRSKKGRLVYQLSDGPSYTGTFVDNELLGKNERRILKDGSLFSIGASSIILKLSDLD